MRTPRERRCLCGETYAAGTYGTHRLTHPPQRRLRTGGRAGSRNPRRDAAIVVALQAGRTLQAVADEYGVTRQRVEQIVKRELGVGVRSFRVPPGPRPKVDRTERTTRRFWTRIAVQPDGCWEWTGGKRNAGYGAAHLPGATGSRRATYAHRVAYTLAKGPIPDGLTIDHLCRNRGCVNPDHLEAVTHRENVLRSPIAQAAINARKTHCVHGHSLADAIVAVGRNGNPFRKCRTCEATRGTRQRAAARARAAA